MSAGRYHLYVSLACPWCHRTAIVRELAGLGEAVPIHYVAPFRDEHGWAFTGERFEDGPGGRYVDPLNGWKLMSEAYLKSDPSYDARVTVPVLWDTQNKRIVNNESSDIIRMFAAGDSLGRLGEKDAKLDLYPSALRADIDEVNLRVYDTINNGVYNAGFARLQGAYERAFKRLFESFAWLEELLGKQRYLLGAQITEADWRLFPTLVRFDEVYHLHFRCNYGGSSSTPTCGPTRASSTSGQGWRRRWRWSRSSAITTRPTTSSTPSTSSRSGPRRIGRSRTDGGSRARACARYEGVFVYAVSGKGGVSSCNRYSCIALLSAGDTRSLHSHASSRLAH